MSARVVFVVGLVAIASTSACYLTVPDIVGPDELCDANHACPPGFLCVTGPAGGGPRCEPPAANQGEGEGEGGEGEGEGDGAGEGEGEGGEGEGGEGEGGEGEGEGVTGCGGPTPCGAADVCVDSGCVARVAPSIREIDGLVADNITASFSVPASATQASPRILDTDHDTGSGTGFAGAVTQTGVPDIAVYVFHDVDIAGFLQVKGTRALAIVSMTTLTIEPGGVIDVSGGPGGPANPGAAPGASIEGSFQADHATSGGGNAMTGGSDASGSAGLEPQTAQQLVPLVGGTSGGDNVDLFGGGGGGAVYLFSEGSINVAGAVRALGGGGGGGPEANAGDVEKGTGGGAGGSILLEAPSVNPGTNLDVRGGGGCSDDGTSDATKLHGGSSGGASVPPASATPCGDGAPGRVRVNTVQPLSTTPPALASCIATASVGRASLASAAVLAPSIPIRPTALSALSPVSGFDGTFAGEQMGTTLVLAAGQLGSELIAASNGSPQTVHAATSFDDPASFTSGPIALDGGESQGGGFTVAVAGSAADNKAVAYFPNTGPGYLTLPLTPNGSVSSFGKAVAVRADDGFTAELFLVAHDAGVRVFSGIAPPFTDQGDIDPVTAAAPSFAFGTVVGVAMRKDVAVVIGTGGVVIYDVAADGATSASFTLVSAAATAGLTTVATDGNLILLASSGDSGCGTDAGSVTVLDTLTGASFAVSSPLPQKNELFGAALAIDGGHILVGAEGEQSTSSSVYAFAYDPFAGPIATGVANGAGAGAFTAVAVDETTAFIGAPLDSPGGKSRAGDVLTVTLP